MPGTARSSHSKRMLHLEEHPDESPVRTLGVFSRDNSFRKACARISTTKTFEYTIIVLILANCVFLALTNPFASCCTQDQVDLGLAVDLEDYSIFCGVDDVLIFQNGSASGEPPCCIDLTRIRQEPRFSHVTCADPKVKQAQGNAEVVFNVLFSMEMIVKVVALGFINARTSYLRDPWNWLDFVVVAVGWLSMIPGVENFSALRTFRVLRPLRTLSSIAGMRPIVNSIVASLPALAQVLLLCTFLFLVFGVVGLQLFSGILTGRCHYIDPSGNGNLASVWPQAEYSAFSIFTLNEADGAPCPLPCYVSPDGKELSSALSADMHSTEANPWSRVSRDCLGLSGPSCASRGPAIIVNPFYNPSAAAAVAAGGGASGNASYQPFDVTYQVNGSYQLLGTNESFTQSYDPLSPAVEVTTFCLNTNVNQLGSGWANFDNFGSACLTIFTSITLEGWSDVMYGLQATFGNPVIVLVYFVLMVMLCSFFMLELTLAVINDEYDKAAAAEEAKLMEEEEELEREETNSDAGSVVDHTPSCFGWHGGPWGPKPFRVVYNMVNSTWFNIAITLLILLNTLTMAMEHHRMGSNLEAFLDTTNSFFTVAFTIEMALKLVGLGVRGYMLDSLNIFDCFIVIMSWVELSVPAGGSSGLGALRTFRLLRVFKLARSWSNLRTLLQTIILSVMDVGNVSILLVLIMFIFSLLGMQLFGGQWTGDKFCEDPDDYVACRAETPRANFDTLAWGLVTVFQVLTGENWNELMYTGLTASGQVSWVYFTLLNVVGNYMVLNLFLAILLARFDNDDEDDDDDASSPPPPVSNPKNSAAVTPLPIEDAAAAAVKGASTNDTKGGGDEKQPKSQRVTPVADQSTEDGGDGETNVDTSPEREADKQAAADVVTAENDLHAIGPVKAPPAPPANTNPNKSTMNGTSLFILGSQNRFRIKVFQLINHDKFDNFILTLIFISTVCLALDEPYVTECGSIPAGTVVNGVESCSGFATFLSTTDMILNVFFTGEMLLKMIALGVALHSHSYLRDGWNVLDFFIVAISLASAALQGAGALKALRSIRSLRALRPLRVVSRNPGMKLVINSIFLALPAIFNVAMVCILFFLILAIVGVQNFMGGMNTCNDPSMPPGTTMFECVGYNQSTALLDIPTLPYTWIPVGEHCNVLPTPALIAQCLQNGTGGCESCLDGRAFPRLWEPTPYNFDNVGNALLVVFEVTSGEMWPDIMYSTMDITGPDQPMREWPHLEGRGTAIWFIAVTIVCAFLMLNVLVGVIIDNFNDMKEKQNGAGLLTPEQKVWVETMRISLDQRPIKRAKPPEHPLRRSVWMLVHSRVFELGIMGAILLNTVVMCASYEGEPISMTRFTNSLNDVFMVVFVIEAALKLFAMDKRYFAVGWNVFDFSLVILSIAGSAGGLGPVASLLRIFRVARIFRLIRTSSGLQTLFRTLIFSIPSIWNVGAILLLMMLIFAIMGMNMFSNVKKGNFLNSDANFDGFFGSMSTLFRMATGESYNGIMHDCMIQEPYCSNEAGTCGFPSFAPVYFTMYFVFSGYILLSMITAIILDNFSDTQTRQCNSVTDEHIDAFKEAWVKLDPYGTMFLDETQLVRVLQHVPHPLGVKGAPVANVGAPISTRKQANRLIQRLHIPSVGGKVAFSDVLTELTHHAMPGVEVPHENEMVRNLNKRKDDEQVLRLKRLGATKANVLYTAATVNGVLIIQSAMRGYIHRKNIATIKAGMVDRGVIKQGTLDANVAKIASSAAVKVVDKKVE